MIHIRRSFLESIRTQLKTIPNYGGVWISRVPPNRNAWPAITLYSDNEIVEHLVIHPPNRPQNRSLTIILTVWIRQTPDSEKAEADMDASALLIEQTITAPAGADYLDLVSTDFQAAEDDADVYAVILTYRLSYSTTESNPIV